MYVCGGEEDTLILANGEVYDPQEDVWTEMNASMSTPRCEFGMCAHDGFLYAFGGGKGVKFGFDRAEIHLKLFQQICFDLD